MGGVRYRRWLNRSGAVAASLGEVSEVVLRNRQFVPVPQLSYGDHGLQAVVTTVAAAIDSGRRIALYADYDVDGTLSCVSWLWFLKDIGYDNVVYYVPDRFREGYGVNLDAVRHLVEEQGAQLILTMDTGITAREEAAWAAERGVEFICTDHHTIQWDKIPQGLVLNPKLHPDPTYQDLCGCGITYVLLRQLGRRFPPSSPDLWHDLLALTGMATICDVVPLGGVNHRLAREGVAALVRSQRPIFRELLAACQLIDRRLDESDIGFRLGPRINAVGRLAHAHTVIAAFVDEDPAALVAEMGRCNEKRKDLQQKVVREALAEAEQYGGASSLFLGGDWHQGVVGIAASKLVEERWCPVWLYDRTGPVCKGSARSIPGVDVTEAMREAAGSLWTKYGGHAAAGGFSFAPEHAVAIAQRLEAWMQAKRAEQPQLWEPVLAYDCELDPRLVGLELANTVRRHRPYGHAFESPVFCLRGEVSRVDVLRDRQSGEPRHTKFAVRFAGQNAEILFFNRVMADGGVGQERRFVVRVGKELWQGRESLVLYGEDLES